MFYKICFITDTMSSVNSDVHSIVVAWRHIVLVWKVLYVLRLRSREIMEWLSNINFSTQLSIMYVVGTV